MNLLPRLALASLVCLAAPALAADAPSRSAELTAFKQAIRVQYDLKERAWAAQDHEALVTGFYSASAFSAAEGAPKYFPQGRAEFLALYKTYVADATRIRVESVHTHVNGDTGWDWANFHADVKPEKVKDYPPSPVRILFLWEKVGGKWLCVGDVVLLGSFDTTARK